MENTVDLHCFSNKDIYPGSAIQGLLVIKLCLCNNMLSQSLSGLVFIYEKKLLHVFLWFISCNNVNRA